MKRFAVILVLLIGLSGCCSHGPFLDQLHDNLKNDIRPTYSELLDKEVEAKRMIPELRDEKIGVVDDSIGAIERIRESGDK